MTACHWILIALAAIGLPCGGCASWHSTPALPSRTSMVLDQLVIFSDTPLPQHHRLLEDLRSQRTYLSTKLALPMSDEPIHVYLFPTAEKLEAYMRVHFPTLPKRRAFFVESDTRLNVYAYWGDRAAEDLRHEVAHGYLHAVVPNLPLWLDEGLAEYFEVPRGLDGVNRPHLDQLAGEPQPPWHPDLERLEQLRASAEMTQAQYAQSWAWAHFLLETSPQRLQILQGYLQSLTKSQTAEPLSAQLHRGDPQYQQELVDHLAVLRQTLR
jgi:hypothetical protein